MSKMNLTEATMLALQGKLAENKSVKKSSKIEKVNIKSRVNVKRKTEATHVKSEDDMAQVAKEYEEAYGQKLDVKNVPCVIARDKMMSGWGEAEGKTAYIVVLCKDVTEAQSIEENMYRIRKEEQLANVHRDVRVPSLRGEVSYCIGKNSPAFNGNGYATKYERKKTESIDINVDDKTNVSVMGDETVVDTEEATIIVDKKEAPVMAPEIPVVPDETVEVPVEGNETIIPEELPEAEPIIDEPVEPSEDIDLPLADEEEKEESVKLETKGTKSIRAKLKENRKLQEDVEADTSKNIADEFKNYKAYKANFGELVINKSGKYFLIFRPDRLSSYIQECPNKDYVEGWLYGCVQAANKVVTPVENGPKMTENKKLQESNKDYDLAVQVVDKLEDQLEGKDFLSKDDFEEMVFIAQREITGIDDYEKLNTEYPDLDSTIRSMLSMSGWATDFTSGDLSTKPRFGQDDDIDFSGVEYSIMSDVVSLLERNSNVEDVERYDDLEMNDTVKFRIGSQWYYIQIGELLDEAKKLQNNKKKVETKERAIKNRALEARKARIRNMRKVEAKKLQNNKKKVERKAITVCDVKSFNEALTRCIKKADKKVESVNVTKAVKVNDIIKLEAKVTTNKTEKTMKLEMKSSTTNKNFTKYTNLKENKSTDMNLTMLTFKNKDNVLECRYINRV